MSSVPSSPAFAPWLAAATDFLLILAFAAIGRDAHAKGDIIAGVFATAWPFLAGAATGWLLSRAWQAPLGLWPAGVVIWLGAVAGGMLLRMLTGQSVVLPFVVVALLSLAVFLLGYRGIVAALRRLRGLARRA